MNRNVLAILAYGLALERQGEHARAARAFGKALQLSPDLSAAQEGLSRIALPGRPYLKVLEQLHQLVQPARYVEIGVDRGASLRLAKAALRIGIDPAPQIDCPPSVAHLIRATSQAAFADGSLAAALGGVGFDLAFVDGSHRFEDVLADIVGLEALAGPNALIAVHDTLPLDAATSTPTRVTAFWTGDTWKAIACLRRIRPTLSITTITTPPSGLTLISGLVAGAASPGLDGAIREARPWPFEAFELERAGFALRSPEPDSVAHTLLNEHQIGQTLG